MPILMLTAHDDEINVTAGLEVGAAGIHVQHVRGAATGSPTWVDFLFLPGILRLGEPYRGHECGCMIEKMRETWQSFKESEPGHRFKDRYRRRQQSKSGRFDLGLVVSMLGGVLIVLGGIVAVPGPGPG